MLSVRSWRVAPPQSSHVSGSAQGASATSAQLPAAAPAAVPDPCGSLGPARGPTQPDTAPAPYLATQALPSTYMCPQQRAAPQAFAVGQGIQPLPPFPTLPDLPEAPTPPAPPVPPVDQATRRSSGRGLSRARIAQGVSEELQRQLGPQRREAESQTDGQAPEGWNWPTSLYRSGTTSNGKVHLYRDCQGLSNSRQVLGTSFCVFCTTRCSYGR